MKKILAILLTVILLALTIVSCGNRSGNANPTDSGEGAVESDLPDGDGNSEENNEENEEENSKEEQKTPTEFDPPLNTSVYSGTPDVSWYTGDKTEYTLTTADQLAGLNKIRNDSEGATTFEGVTVKLGADMIFNDGLLEQILADGDKNKPWITADPSYTFNGTLDGQNHTVSGIYLKLETTEGASGVQGILGALSGNAAVKNLRLINSVVTGPAATDEIKLGTLISRVVGDTASVTVSNVEVHSSVNEGGHRAGQLGGAVGGIVGAITSAGTLTLSNCHFNGTLSFPNSTNIAGFVGMAKGGTTIILNNCHGDGIISGGDYVAGLSGYENSTNKESNGSCINFNNLKCAGSNKNASFK